MKYYYTSILSFKKMNAYKFQIFSRLIGDVIFLVMWLSVWNALFQTNHNSSVTKDQVLIYVISTQFLIGTMNNSKLLFRVQEDIKSGNIISDLMKPISYLLYNFSKDIGQIVYYLIFVGIPIYTTCFYLLGLSAETNIYNFIVFSLSSFLGFLIRYLIEFIYSMLTFIFVEIDGLNTLFYFIIQLMAGAVIPLWYFPETLKFLVWVLPFKEIYFTPASILSQYDTEFSLFVLVAKQGFWIIFFYILSIFVWKKCIRRIYIQGG